MQKSVASLDNSPPVILNFILNYYYTSPMFLSQSFLIGTIAMLLLLLLDLFLKQSRLLQPSLSLLSNSILAAQGDEFQNIDPLLKESKKPSKGFALNEPLKQEKLELRPLPAKKKSEFQPELNIFYPECPFSLDSIYEKCEEFMLLDKTEKQAGARLKIAKMFLRRNSSDDLNTFSDIVTNCGFFLIKYVPNSRFTTLTDLKIFMKKLIAFEEAMENELASFKQNCIDYILDRPENRQKNFNSEILEAKVNYLMKRVIFELFVRAAMAGSTSDDRSMCVCSSIVSTIDIKTEDLKRVFYSCFPKEEKFTFRNFATIMNVYIFNYSNSKAITGSLRANLLKNAILFPALIRKLNSKNRQVEILASLAEFNLNNPLIDSHVREYLKFHRENLHKGKKPKNKQKVN
jgi:hypothetical protein